MSKRMYFSIVIGTFLLVAVFMAWYDKSQAFTALQLEVSKGKEAATPKLEGRFEQVALGQQGGDKLFLLTLAIANSGAPSVAGGFALKIAYASGHSSDWIGPSWIPDNSGLVYKDTPGTSKLDHKDSLFEKTNTPISPGDVRVGMLFFRLAQNAATPTFGDKLIIQFFDYKDNRYEITNTLGTNGREGPPVYFPGGAGHFEPGPTGLPSSTPKSG
jgi:hypothetical protein